MASCVDIVSLQTSPHYSVTLEFHWMFAEFANFGPSTRAADSRSLTFRLCLLFEGT